MALRVIYVSVANQNHPYYVKFGTQHVFEVYKISQKQSRQER